MKKLTKMQFAIISLLFLFSISAIIAIWMFTSQTGDDSNGKSRAIAKGIENFVAQFVKIDPNTPLWRSQLNHTLRKAGHFVEYMFLGFTFCLFLNVLLLQVRKPAIYTLVFSFFMAAADEFRQGFVAGRNPRLFDVGIDIFGAVYGTLLAVTMYSILWKNGRLKRGGPPKENNEKPDNEAG